MQSANGIWSSYCLTSNEYLQCYKQFLETKANNINSIIDQISDGAVNDSAIQDTAVAIGDAVISSAALAIAIKNGNDVISDITGNRSIRVDDAVDDLGTIVSSATVNVAFVDALASTDDPAASTSVFSNLIAARLGQLTSKTSKFADMCLTILGSAADVNNKLATFFKSMLPEVSSVDNQGNATGFKSITWECTGASPASLFMETINITNPLGVVATVVLKARKIINNFYTAIFKGAKKLGSKAAVALKQMTVDALDVKTNDEYGDFSFNEGMIKLGANIDWANDHASSIDDVNTHAGEYYTLPLLGGTVYVSSTDGSIYLKPHMYSFSAAVEIAEQLRKSLYQLKLAAEQGSANFADVIDMYAEVIAGAANSIAPFDIKTSDDERSLFKSLLITKAIFLCSMLLVDRDNVYEDEVGTDGRFSYLYRLLTEVLEVMSTGSIQKYTQYSAVSEDLYASSHVLYLATNIFNINHAYLATAVSNNVITNVDWVHQVAYDISDVSTAATLAQQYLLQGVHSYIHDSMSVTTEELFLPYQWRQGQFGGRYSVKSDAENAAAFRNVLIAIAVVVILVVVVKVGVKLRSNLKLKAEIANAQFQSAMWDGETDIKKLKKMQKKANRLSKMSGISFPDTATEAYGSLFGVEHQASDLTTMQSQIYRLQTMIKSE